LSAKAFAALDHPDARRALNFEFLARRNIILGAEFGGQYNLALCGYGGSHAGKISIAVNIDSCATSLHLLPAGKRRKRLETWFKDGIAKITCLAWDSVTGLRWAKLLADLRSAGKAMPIKDSMIAATALVHDLTIATRSLADFRVAGVKLLDPFA
jgi:hypothetical protein